MAGLVAGIAIAAATAGVYAAATEDDGTAVDADTDAVVEDASDAAVVAESDTPTSIHELVVNVRPSIVAIHTSVSQTDPFGREVDGEASGSGFVLSQDGFIVTNNHVIEGADRITVTLDDGSVEDAELIGGDARTDLAVLQIDRTDLVALPLGDSDALRVGEQVVAIGNALDLGSEPTVTTGIVSAKSRQITEPNGQVLVNLLQTDTAINPGNSGGPLLDMNGNVVGINTAISGNGQNIGFAISIEPAKALIEQLRNGEDPRHALLGVSTTPTDDGAPGAAVRSIQPGSGADASELEVDDVITAIGDDEIGSPEDLVAAIAALQPDDTVELTVDRDGETLTFGVTLGAHDEARS